MATVTDTTQDPYSMPPESSNVVNMPAQKKQTMPPIPPTDQGEEDLKAYNR
jgi:hypothetical protein